MVRSHRSSSWSSLGFPAMVHARHSLQVGDGQTKGRTLKGWVGRGHRCQSVMTFFWKEAVQIPSEDLS